jgi:hypothetical protein
LSIANAYRPSPIAVIQEYLIYFFERLAFLSIVWSGLLAAWALMMDVRLCNPPRYPAIRRILALLFRNESEHC